MKQRQSGVDIGMDERERELSMLILPVCFCIMFQLRVEVRPIRTIFIGVLSELFVL